MICSYCGQGGHSAVSCPRRARTPSQKRLNAEQQFRSVSKRPIVIEHKRKPRKVDPDKLAEWRADLVIINRELEGMKL